MKNNGSPKEKPAREKSSVTSAFAHESERYQTNNDKYYSTSSFVNARNRQMNEQPGIDKLYQTMKHTTYSIGKIG
jgi:hypothetical protein